MFVDGHFAIGVHVDVAVAEGLRVGRKVDVVALERLAHAEEWRRAKESALHLLGYRARSREELRQRLERKGYEAELVVEVLESLTRGGFLNDQEFSEAWVAGRTGSRAMGPVRLAAELRSKGVDKETIQEALAPLDDDAQLRLAVEVAQKRAGRLSSEEPREARKKLAAMLIRRGFGWQVAAKAVNAVLSADDEDDLPPDE